MDVHITIQEDELQQFTEKLILEKLIAKYERSQAYKSRESQTRRILVKPSEFKKIDFEAYDQKEAFINALIKLKSESVIEYSWQRYEVGNLIDSVWLIQNPESISKAYGLAQIAVSYDQMEVLLKKLRTIEFVYYEWMNAFKEELIEKFERTGKFGNLMTSDLKVNADLIECLIAIEKLALSSVHERVLSASVFGDSKYFQTTLKARLIPLIQRYNDVDEEEPLQMVCLFSNPELIFYSGPLQLCVDSGVIDSSFLDQGSVILGSYVDKINTITLSRKVDKIITIENRASYELLIKVRPENALIVYHGGFASKLKRTFLAKLYHAFPGISFYHWSDIDLGGARIYKILKNIIPDVKPLMMDSSVLQKYCNEAVPIEAPYRLKLTQMLSDEKDLDVRGVVECILERGLKLEQEHILISDVIKLIDRNLPNTGLLCTQRENGENIS